MTKCENYGSGVLIRPSTCIPKPAPASPTTSPMCSINNGPISMERLFGAMRQRPNGPWLSDRNYSGSTANAVQRPRANAVPSPSGILPLVTAFDSTESLAPAGISTPVK